MKKLTKSAFNRARDFLATGSRKLEWHLFEYHFHGIAGSREKVIKELKFFQNPDGGFGKKLEPDIRMEDSSVVATKFALQILIDIQATVEEKLVQDGIAYLLNTYDKQKSVWPLVTEKVMDAPHAPWWDVEGLEKEFGSYLANPKAGVLRCLLEYQELVPKELIEYITKTVIAHFEKLPTKMNFFDAISYLLLYQAEGLDNEDKKKLFSKLQKTGIALVNTNPSDWTGFAIKPLWLSPSPISPLANTFGGLTEQNLDFEITNQNKDGSWSPTWSWGTSYPTSWKVAEKEWKGVLTLATLRSLRDYGRIDEHEPKLSGYKYHID